MEIGKAIREVRRERGMLQKDLAEACGLSVNAMASIERGRSIPTKETVLAICQALIITPADYLQLYSLKETDVPKEKRSLWQFFILLRKFLIEDNSEGQ